MLARNVDCGKSDILFVTIVVWNESNAERFTGFSVFHSARSAGTWNREKREVLDILVIDAGRHLRGNNDVGVHEEPHDP